MPTKNEKQNKKLIRTIAELVILSIPRHDVGIIDKGIVSLEGIAIKFLQNRAEQPQRFQIVERSVFSPDDKVQNQYMSYVCDELLRIFKVSIDDRDEYTSKQVIRSYYKILATALKQSNNRIALKSLFDFKEYRGSLHLQMVDFAIEKNAKLEKYQLFSTLQVVPELFLTGRDYESEYIEEFISFHTFRIFQLIIDKNDFESFVDLLEYFTSSLFVVRNPNIHGLLLDLCLQNYNEPVYKQIEKIVDTLDYEFKKDYTLSNKNVQFGRVTDEFDKLEDLLIQQGMEKSKIENAKNIFLGKLNKLYIVTLLSSVFFVVGAYLLHKGEKYSHWLSEIWYYTKPEHSHTTYVNELPIMREPLSEICLAMYEGIGSRLGSRIDFGRYSDAIPYLYQYAVLSMLRDDKCMTFPSNGDIAGWKKNGRTVPMMFWYEVLTLLDMNNLTNALEALKLGFIDAIRPEGSDISKRVDELRQNLKKLADAKKSQTEQLELVIDVSQKLIGNQVTRIKNYYKEESQIPLLALTDENSTGEFVTITSKSPLIPRRCFIEQDFIGHILDNLDDIGIIDKERRRLYDVLSEQLQEQKIEFDLAAFESVVQDMKSKGYHPNVIFVPIGILDRVGHEKNPLYSLSSPTIEIAGETLKIVLSRGDWQFTNILIYDKSHLKVTYKGEIDVSVSDTDKKEVTFDSSIDMRIEVLDLGAFIYILDVGTSANL